MNSLAKIENKQLSIWDGDENLLQIKKLFAPKLNANEFIILVEMGKATGLNPYLKEIWAVKYKESEPAQIFVGRDGYRKSAQRHPSYDYHTGDAVYSNDIFERNNGEIVHKYSLKDRGNLMGAYCLAQRKGSSRPTYVYVDITEYNKGFSVWKEKPSTMIKKVAEAQALKAAFQELFANTYSEYEAWDNHESHSHQEKARGVEGLKQKLGISKEDINETINIIEAEFNHLADEISESIRDMEENKKDEISSEAETVKFLIESASSKKELLAAMKHLKDLKDVEKKIVYEFYKQKDAELNATA